MKRPAMWNKVEVKGAYVESAGQQFLCTFVRDITERKQAEEALEKPWWP